MTSVTNTSGGSGGGAGGSGGAKAGLPALPPFCAGRGSAGWGAGASGGSGAGSGGGWRTESAALTAKRPVLVMRTATEWPDAGLALRKQPTCVSTLGFLRTHKFYVADKLYGVRSYTSAGSAKTSSKCCYHAARGADGILQRRLKLQLHAHDLPGCS